MCEIALVEGLMARYPEQFTEPAVERISPWVRRALANLLPAPTLAPFPRHGR